MNRVVHFEIQAEDPVRAKAFYSSVFGWDIKQWGDQKYWMVMTGGDTKPAGADLKQTWGGIDGGLLPRSGPTPAEGAPVNAFVCTVDVQNLEEMLKKVTATGGKTVVPVSAIPTVGWLAYCKDTEGNIFGLMQSDESAK